ncbi:MAG TPA: hypothetical protein VFH94_07925 [Streptomyces sp.]|nr:hypothetical protein [Streptomyces sp.]
MAEVDELLDGVAVRLPDVETIRAKGRRRRIRKTVATAVFTTVAVAAGVWAVLPGAMDGREEERGTVATTPENPFRRDGVVQLWPADEMPLYGKWHWRESAGPRESAGARSLSGPLPEVGLDGACPRSFASDRLSPPNQSRYSRQYEGTRAAKAQQRIAEYDDAATARAELGLLRDELKACGLRPSAEKTTDDRVGAEGTDLWRGTVEGGRTMRVYLESWGTWVSGAEVLDGTDGRGGTGSQGG